ncbi:MAG: TetR family transcriptional regulator [Dehalococcoidia bacterium]|nr:TetR family transcriptional regulator [Dehalococcoidia bacterium]
MPAVPKASDAPSAHRSQALPARARILVAANGLFYRHGIRAVGVNAVIAAADVAKATFYQHFPAKDDLMVAWLQGGDARWFDRLREIAEREARAPHELVPAFFEALAAWVATDEFRGCGFINSAVELPATHPARSVIEEHSHEIETYFRDALRRAGFPDADAIAEEAYVLMVGAIVAAMTRRTADPARRATASVRRLLNNASEAG